jgi:hypothetical protein
MQKSHWAVLLAIAVLIVLGFVIARSFYFGTGTTSNYVAPERELGEVGLERAAVSARNMVEGSGVSTEGAVLVDFAHSNALFVEELNTLFSGLVSRGLTYEIVSASAEDADAENGHGLIDRLKYAKALILPLPREPYTDEEIAEIERFVKNGGQVLIIGDPTRTVEVDALNSIAGSFGVIYADDYLYSLNEESIDNNYRNVIYTDFAESPLTTGLSDGDKLIFYSGMSIYAPGDEIVLGDEYTLSSTSEGGRTMAAASLTADDQVLAIGDLTFLNEPYSAAESNGIFINNIADFLASSQRSYELRDFPYFFNQNVDVVFDDPRVFNSQFEDSVQLKDMLEQYEYNVAFTDAVDTSNDVIFIGRFNDTEMVQEYLDAANIVILDPKPKAEEGDSPENIEQVSTSAPAADESGVTDRSPTVADTTEDKDLDQDFIEGRISIAGVGELERGGSTLFYLHHDGERNILIILSDTPDTNADAFELLFDNELSECAVGEAVAVCQTGTPGKALPPSIRSTRVDKILVVSDDDGRARDEQRTSAAEYTTALSGTYKITDWATADDGSPSLDELQEYDAVIWTTGDYWDDSIGVDDAETLTKYVEEGGNLIMSGASIAFDWDHSEFLETIVHADYLDFAGQDDIELVIEDHPIARGFSEGQVLTFTVAATGLTESQLLPDVVNHTADSRVIFVRGPQSEQSGAASVIAYEDDRSKIAYLAFPVYQLSDSSRQTLANNIIDWFTRKPLDLPDKDDYKPFELDDNEPRLPGDEDETPSDGETPPENGDENGNNADNNGEENTDGDNGSETDGSQDAANNGN